MSELDASDDLRDTVHTLRALTAIAETGSFTRAAERMGQTPSAISKTIARAEQRLGVRLVQRTTRRAQLTADAAQYLARGRELLGELAALESSLVDRSTTMRGRVRISAPSVYGALFVAPVVAAVRRDHPELRIDLRCEDRMVDLVSDGVDVAVRFLSAPPEGLVAKPLHDDDRGLFASTAYLRAHAAPRTLAELDRHARLHYGAPRAEAAFASDSVLAVREAARAGAGIAELPRYLAAEDLAHGALVEVLPGTMPARRRVYAVYLPARPQAARVRVVIERLIAALGQPRKRR